MDRRSSSGRRKYAPPPPIGGAKDDLHEWSIFRQNLTSSIAESLLRSASPNKPALATATGAQSEQVSGLPYGDFQMHDDAVESVLQRGRSQDQFLADKAQAYLRFGLPRVALTNDRGEYALSRPGGLDYKNRKSQSEMDIRRAVLEAPAPRGPYYMKSSTSMDIINLIGRPQPTYDPPRFGSYRNLRSSAMTSDPIGRPMTNGHWRSQLTDLDTTTAASGSERSFRTRLRAPLSVVLPSISIDQPDQPSISSYHPPLLPSASRSFQHSQRQHHHHHHQQQQQQHHHQHQHQQPPTLLSKTSASIGSFLQGKRHHHGHYFSNLDLFSASIAYNYLRYAKAEELQNNLAKEPHLQLRHFGFEIDRRSAFDTTMLRAPKYRRILADLSFEVFGGETLAVLYTSEEEVTTLLSLLSNKHNLRGRTDGNILVNGLSVSGKFLQNRIAYVCSHELHPHLTVNEHLRIRCGLLKPTNTSYPSSSMITNLIHTLALGPFQDRLVCELGRTEKVRVKIACQMLLETDILILDDLFKDIDLYDMAFLIDYLRDWAAKLNRIIIVATNPPTFEILSMYHKVLVLASGQTIYFGRTQQMLNYFESLNYPCPLFKNPCDYYVDLVTHDYLTIDAAMESDTRIARLAEAWKHRAPPLSELGQSSGLSIRFSKANTFVATMWIYYRFWLLFLNRPWQTVKEILLSLLMSTILGAIFYELTASSQAGINDRFGLFYAMLNLFPLGNWLLNIERVHSERLLLTYDTEHDFSYGVSFIIARFCFDLPVGLIAYVAYAIPLYFMAQLRSIAIDHGRIFGVYLALTVAYCMCVRLLALATAYLFAKKLHAAIVTGVALSFYALTSGISLHPNDRSFLFADWVAYVSPSQWTHQMLSQQELIGNATALSTPNLRKAADVLEFGCDVRQVKFGPIVTTSPCPVADGFEALRFANLTWRGLAPSQNATHYVGLSVMAGFGLLFTAICCFASALCHHPAKVKVRRRES